MIQCITPHLVRVGRFAGSFLALVSSSKYAASKPRDIPSSIYSSYASRIIRLLSFANHAVQSKNTQSQSSTCRIAYQMGTLRYATHHAYAVTSLLPPVPVLYMVVEMGRVQKGMHPLSQGITTKEIRPSSFYGFPQVGPSLFEGFMFVIELDQRECERKSLVEGVHTSANFIFISTSSFSISAICSSI